MVKKRINAVLDTYGAGTRGEPLRPSDDTRLQQIAHRLGGMTNKRIERENAALDSLKMKQLDRVLQSSQGLNKQAMQILRSATAIPNQGASYPGWGVVNLKTPNRAFGNPAQPGDSVSWHNAFSFGTSIDPSRRYTPLLEDSPILLVDSVDWSHDALRLPVRNIHISCDAEFGQDTDLAGASTVVHINSTEYNPDRIDLDGSDAFTGSARFEISTDGLVTSAQFGREYVTGYVSEADSHAMHIGLAELFDSVQLAVSATAEAYADSAL